MNSFFNNRKMNLILVTYIIPLNFLSIEQSNKLNISFTRQRTTKSGTDILIRIHELIFQKLKNESYSHHAGHSTEAVLF